MSALNKTILLLLAVGLMLTALTASAETRVTYQGRLEQSGSPYTGNADMRFQMFDAATGGDTSGPSIVRNAVPVTDGLFQVELDFGAEVFDKTPLWLQVVIDGEELTPRQPVTAAPVAIQALNATNAGDIDGVSAGFGLTGGGSSGTVSLAVDTSEIQRRVASSCNFGSAIRSISATGGVTCEIDDTGALSLPFSGSASTSLSGEVFEITNTGSGNAIVGRSSYEGDQTWIPAIYGVHESPTGPGDGVQGTTDTIFNGSAGVRGRALGTSGEVYGVYGFGRSATGYGGFFTNNSGAALAADGPSDGTDLYLFGDGIIRTEENELEIRVPNPSPTSFFKVFRISAVEANVGELLALYGHGDLVISGSLTQNSDRAVKHDIAAVEPEGVLMKIAELPIATWRYNDDPDTLHLGPMAQDFHAAFGLGNDPTGISAIDADGVALAAIQGLLERIESQQRRIETLESELDSRESRMARRIARLEVLLTGNSLAGAQDESAPASP